MAVRRIQICINKRYPINLLFHPHGHDHPRLFGTAQGGFSKAVLDGRSAEVP